MIKTDQIISAIDGYLNKKDIDIKNKYFILKQMVDEYFNLIISDDDYINDDDLIDDDDDETDKPEIETETKADKSILKKPVLKIKQNESD